MIYQRYLIGPSDGSTLHGNYSRVERLWEHADGTCMFRVECDDPGFARLLADPLLDVLPSLNAPASAVASSKLKSLLNKNSFTPAQGDTLLNVLRKLRDTFGPGVLIDQPH